MKIEFKIGNKNLSILENEIYCDYEGNLVIVDDELFLSFCESDAFALGFILGLRDGYIVKIGEL